MKHRFVAKIAGCTLAALMLAVTVLPTAALTPAYPITGTYLSSTYYDNLIHLPRTGDKAFDTVAIALSQLDYHEGNSTADFDGENTAGYRNYTEYNHALGQIGGTYGYAWCAAFVSWCLEEADAADSAGGLFASCTLWVEALQSLGQYSTRASGYIPKAGDIIFFRSPGVSRASDHVGLVRYVKGGRVYTVEGNSSDQVSLRDYALGDTYIRGYGRPRYQSTYLLPHTALECEDAVNGWYTVTNRFVNVRAKASSTSAKRGTLEKGDMVRVMNLQNGWGMIYYKDQPAYISLDYADFTAPLSYMVKYKSDGGEGLPASHSYFSMQEAFVSATVPVREGYTFEGWQSGEHRSVAGDRLPMGDVTLVAVWQAIPVAEPLTTPGETPPTQDENTENSGDGDAFLAPPGAEDDTVSVQTPTQEGVPSQGNSTATLAAGIVVGVTTAGLGGWWLWRRLRKRA